MCPAWGVPGANLSVGYYQEHTKAEYLRLPELYRTAARVRKMLEELAASPSPVFSYVEDRWEDWRDYGFSEYHDDVPPPVRLVRSTPGKKYKILKGAF
ncbi:MAG: hypothetical protein HPY89_00580 [Pelotomaculum sp.]|nr:hypothetical protein [Pelotomaculum sp.]